MDDGSGDDFAGQEYSVVQLVEMLEFGYFAEHQPETERFPELRVFLDAIAASDGPHECHALVARYRQLATSSCILMEDRGQLMVRLASTYLQCACRALRDKDVATSQSWLREIEKLLNSECSEMEDGKTWKLEVADSLRRYVKAMNVGSSTTVGLDEAFKEQLLAKRSFDGESEAKTEFSTSSTQRSGTPGPRPR
jgi:hypothetical protein